MFLGTQLKELRAPEALVLPDERKRLTRFFGVAHSGVLPAELAVTWGTVDPFPDPPSGWSGLRLTARQLTDEIPPGGRDRRPVVMMVYEQIAESAETEVGGPTTTQLEDGREALVEEAIQFSTGTYVPRVVGSANPDDATQFLLKEEAVDDGGLRRIKRTYVTAGIIAQDDQLKNQNKLQIRTITSVKTVPSTPVGFTLIGTPVQNPNGLPIYTYTFAYGVGLISDSIDARPEGLRVRTYVSLGTKQTPAGVIIRDDYEERDGYRQFTVSCMQSATGGSPDGTPFTFDRYVPFTYPGRAKPYTTTVGSYTMIDAFQSPPIETPILARVAISYQADDEIGTLTDPLWAPEEWATLTLKMVTRGPSPLSVVKALPGYRSVDDTPLTLTGGGVGEESAMGYDIYFTTTATLTVEGGPAAPDGNTYTLEARLEPAFSASDGTLWYRKTLIVAEIPTQPALPV